MTAGMTGGLGNAADNPEAVKLLKQGIRNNDDVAEAYLNRVRPELRGINNEAAGMVDSSLSSRINVPETIASECARYGDYMAAHGADEVMNFVPTREQLETIKPESSFNPNKGLIKSEAETLLRERASQQGLGIYNDELSNVGNDMLGINHFLGTDRRPFIRTLNNTIEKTDVKFTWGENSIILKNIQIMIALITLWI